MVWGPSWGRRGGVNLQDIAVSGDEGLVHEQPASVAAMAAKLHDEGEETRQLLVAQCLVLHHPLHDLQGSCLGGLVPGGAKQNMHTWGRVGSSLGGGKQDMSTWVRVGSDMLTWVRVGSSPRANRICIHGSGLGETGWAGWARIFIDG